MYRMKAFCFLTVIITGKVNSFNISYSNLKCLSLQLIFLNNNTMDNKTTGTVKFFNSEKGFGFIKHDDSSKETFVHASGLIDEIKENDKVEFDLQNGQKGMNAVNVKLIG